MHKELKTLSSRDSGAKEDEGDTVYLLAKNLAHTVLTGTDTKLKEALEKVKGEEIVAFAEALKGSDAELDKKICKNRKKDLSG